MRAHTWRTFAAGSAGWKLFVEMFSLMVTNVNGILFCPPGATKTKRKFNKTIIIQRVAICSQLARMCLPRSNETRRSIASEERRA